MARTIAICLESGSKRTFASAMEWPGWSRSGRSEQEAMDALLTYGPRYAAAISLTGVGFRAPRSANELEVSERLAGGSGTDFGVPGATWSAEARPVTPADLRRLSQLLEAAWRTFDASARAAEGATLRKGPRGGGRDLDRIVLHVLEAEQAYLTQLGSRVPKGGDEDTTAQMRQVRERVLETLSALARGEPLADPNRVTKRWSPRYFVRRSAWHALDHAWEIEDRRESE
jgi:hypothetical protein